MEPELSSPVDPERELPTVPHTTRAEPSECSDRNEVSHRHALNIYQKIVARTKLSQNVGLLRGKAGMTTRGNKPPEWGSRPTDWTLITFDCLPSSASTKNAVTGRKNSPKKSTRNSVLGTSQSLRTQTETPKVAAVTVNKRKVNPQPPRDLGYSRISTPGKKRRSRAARSALKPYTTGKSTGLFTPDERAIMSDIPVLHSMREKVLSAPYTYLS